MEILYLYIFISVTCLSVFFITTHVSSVIFFLYLYCYSEITSVYISYCIYVVSTLSSYEFSIFTVEALLAWIQVYDCPKAGEVRMQNKVKTDVFYHKAPS